MQRVSVGETLSIGEDVLTEMVKVASGKGTERVGSQALRREIY